MTRIALFAGVTVLLVSAGASLALPVFSDNFNDNTRGPTWSLVQDDAANTWLAEANGRLELHANSTAAKLDALYLSDGASPLRLSTAADFQIKAAFHFSGTSTAPGGGGAVDLGFGADADGKNSLSIAAGYGGLPVFGAQYRVNDVPSTPAAWVRVGNDGTLYLSYDSTLDAVYVSTTGFGAANAHTTYSGLVQGSWAATDVLIGLGGYTDRMAISNGEAWLDDFEVVAGQVVPEPATALLLLGLGAVTLLRRRGRRAPR